jgi:hypothetical protein
MSRVVLIGLLVAVALAPPANGAGSRFAIEDGTPREQAQVRGAIGVSAFDWSILPRVVTIRIVGNGGGSSSTPGLVVLDAALLDAGRLSWGVVLHELAHQVDFLVLDDVARRRLGAVLGGAAWWPAPGLAHAALDCERFASTLAWAYWPSGDNVMRPESTADEAGAIAPTAFRTLLGSLLASVRDLRALRR